MNSRLWTDHLTSWKAFLNECISLTEDGGERKKYKRQIRTIERVRCGAVLNPGLLSEFISPTTEKSEETVCEKYYFDLNDSQKNAVKLALGENVLSMIQGPPGTGKTQVIAEICLQLLSTNPGLRILVCSETHVAVNNLLSRIAQYSKGIRIVRIRNKENDGAVDEFSPETIIDSYLRWASESIQNKVAYNIKGDTIKEERRMYLHLYFNPDKFADDGKALNRKLDGLKEELLSGKRVPEHEKDYRKYFEIKETPKRGVSLSYKQEAIDAARERYGFFVLISNEVKDPVTALSLYRMRDVIEKAFWNIKERLNLRRTLTSSESSLEGKLFVEFVALIYLSYIKKKMEEAGLFSRYTMHELLDELDVIECFQEPGKAPIQGEVLKKQEQIYRDLGVEPLLATPEIQ